MIEGNFHVDYEADGVFADFERMVIKHGLSGHIQLIVYHGHDLFTVNHHDQLNLIFWQWVVDSKECVKKNEAILRAYHSWLAEKELLGSE